MARDVRRLNPMLAEDVAHIAGAVEAARRRSAPYIRNAQIAAGRVQDRGGLILGCSGRSGLYLSRLRLMRGCPSSVPHPM